MSSFLSKVLGGIKHAVVVVSHAFESLFGKQAAQDFGKAAVEVLKSEAGKLALDVVEALEASTPALSGSVKQAQAFTKLSAELKSAGHDVPASLVNLLIELAVNAIKGHISAVEAIPSPAPSPAPESAPSQA